MTKTDNSFYRFRSIDGIFGKNMSLERQEIYFATPEQLNDPMEGFKDIFWNGDQIVWRNFMRHYLLCLVRQLSLVVISGEKYDPDLSKNVVLFSTIDHPSLQFKDIFEEICNLFFGESMIEEIALLLSQCTHKIRRPELCLYVQSWHGFATFCVTKIFQQKGLLPPDKLPELDFTVVRRLFELTKRMLSEVKKERNDYESSEMRRFFEVADQFGRSYSAKRVFTVREKHKLVWINAVEEYPERYISSLDRLIFFEWFTACFSSSPNQASMWGLYADSHKGVCLKFRASSSTLDKCQISLSSNLGGKGVPIRKSKYPFIKVKYGDKFPEIDFFRSLGRLSRAALLADWYTGLNGEVSVCADGLIGSQGWERYNKSFVDMISSKLSDWDHEYEYRLVISSVLGEFENKPNRLLAYDFDDLEGIIFGIKTSMEDKKRIYNLIRRKCTELGRTEFSFGQAYYSSALGRIEISDFDLPIT